MNIITISDCTGDTQLQKDTSTVAKFNIIRDAHDKSYIYKLLGAELGTLFIASLDGNGVPVGARYLAIYNAFAQDADYGKVVESKGIKFFLSNIIWFYYARQNNVVISTGGNKAKKSENSDQNADGFLLGRNYNAAINTSRAIQWYIVQNIATYPEYKGQRLKFMIGL